MKKVFLYVSLLLCLLTACKQDEVSIPFEELPTDNIPFVDDNGKLPDDVPNTTEITTAHTSTTEVPYELNEVFDPNNSAIIYMYYNDGGYVLFAQKDGDIQVHTEMSSDQFYRDFNIDPDVFPLGEEPLYSYVSRYSNIGGNYQFRFIRIETNDTIIFTQTDFLESEEPLAGVQTLYSGDKHKTRCYPYTEDVDFDIYPATYVFGYDPINLGDVVDFDKYYTPADIDGIKDQWRYYTGENTNDGKTINSYTESGYVITLKNNWS